MTDFYLIAKISSLYKSDGSVKITSYSDFPERFYNLNKVFIDFFGKYKEFIVESISEHKGSFVLKFKNFDSKEHSSDLLDKNIFVTKEELVALPEDTYFVHDLVGSIVYQGITVLGRIIDVYNLPANDVYVVEKEDGEELLIPAVSEFVERFDLNNKALYLVPGKDLYDEDYED